MCSLDLLLGGAPEPLTDSPHAIQATRQGTRHRGLLPQLLGGCGGCRGRVLVCSDEHPDAWQSKGEETAYFERSMPEESILKFVFTNYHTVSRLIERF